jgi:putative addiction module component (TIGR02574 family)
MSLRSRDVLDQALKLRPVERAQLVEDLLASFEFPDRQRIDELWATEAEARIEAYERGEIPSTLASEVFDEIDRGKTS